MRRGSGRRGGGAGRAAARRAAHRRRRASARSRPRSRTCSSTGWPYHERPLEDLARRPSCVDGPSRAGSRGRASARCGLTLDDAVVARASRRATASPSSGRAQDGRRGRRPGPAGGQTARRCRPRPATPGRTTSTSSASRRPVGPAKVIYPDIPDNFRTRLDFQWPIYTFGRVDALERAAQAEAGASGLDLEAGQQRPEARDHARVLGDRHRHARRCAWSTSR